MKKPRSKQPPSSKQKSPVSKTAASAVPIGGESLRQWLVYGCLAIIFIFVIVVRYRLFEMPLERDEGEYALMGQLILKGIPPYEMAYNMKLPGTYYMFALLMSFLGQTIAGIHAGLLLINLISILLLFFIGKKLLNPTSGLFAAASYALISMAPGALGLAAHATHFNVLFILAGLLALLYYEEKPNLMRLAISGFCFGLSFIMKQQAVFLMLFGVLAFGLIEQKRTPFKLLNTVLRLGVVSAAMLLPYALVLLSAWYTGTFATFWHWTVEYAGQYARLKTESNTMEILRLNFTEVVFGFKLFWWLGLLGLGALFVSAAIRKYRWIILLFAISSLACVVPGLYFRTHYFIIFFPALGLLVSIVLNFFNEQLSRLKFPILSLLPFLLFGFMTYQAILTHGHAFFSEDPNELSLNIYGASNPFQESIEIAKYIKANSTEQDKIAILGSEPQIYFYSDRLPATGFIYTYPLMENQSYSDEMQQEMIAEIEKSKPKFLIFVKAPFSWLYHVDSSRGIFDWNAEYSKNFDLVGLVDLNPSGKATYVWGDELVGYTVKNESQIWIYQQKITDPGSTN